MSDAPSAGRKRRRPRVVLCGTYDLGKPRTRLLRGALIRAGCEITEIHVEVWSGIEDKSRITGVGARLKQAIRWLAAYPNLVRRYFCAPGHDVVLIPYLGHLDMLVIGTLARIARKPVIWDAFLSLHDTVVTDRRLVRPGGFLARCLALWEGLACRIASIIVLDTAAQANFFRTVYRVPQDKLAVAFVGAEENFAPASFVPEPTSNAEYEVLFYGQFIPLHGIETIIAAAQKCSEPVIRWTIVGTGQEREPMAAIIAAGPPANLEWIEWVPYPELADRIARADVCLGVFGSSEKAGRVIPNKVFQILASGKPLVTRDGPGIRELITPGTPSVILVPPGDSNALLEAVEAMRGERSGGQSPLHRDLVRRFDADALACQWRVIVEAALEHYPVK